MEPIITSATVMAMYLASASNVNSPYYYNASMEDGKVATMEVLNNNGGSLTVKGKYKYEYDALGRLTSKTAYKRDIFTGDDVPSYRLVFSYNEDGYMLERCKWDARHNMFAMAGERTEYRRMGNHTVSVSQYKYDGNRYTRTGSVLVMDPHDGYLLANAATLI